jgi:uncharacterized protein
LICNTATLRAGAVRPDETGDTEVEEDMNQARQEQDNTGTPPAANGDGSDAPPARRVQVHEEAAQVHAAAWDALLAASPEPTPFLRHAYLAAMTDSGSATPETGWQPLWLTLDDSGSTADAPRYEAGCVLYFKQHSYGEYVFDWAWADAYQRHGLAYYPKLLGAVPFTPVPGSRLLARSDTGRALLLQAIEQLMQAQDTSSAHLLFMAEADRQSAQAAGWLLRSTVQFHWHNRVDTPYADFADFLASLQRDKRKKIAQERRYVAEAGVTFRALRGAEISESDWDFFYRCYTLTYLAHRNRPYLTRAFFAAQARDMPEHWLLFVAERGGERVAASLIAIDPARRVAYGRYWGATAPVNCLHFEACYYQPLQWCIAQGWHRFEGGAQGEHKMARGLLPVQTWSAHKLSHPSFEDAVARFLAQEGQGIAAYVDELRERNPFKAAE